MAGVSAWASVSSARVVVTAVEIGYGLGRAAALVDAEHVPGHAAGAHRDEARRSLGDTGAGISTLLRALRATGDGDDRP